MRYRPLVERVIESINRRPKNVPPGCWAWEGAHDSDGYPIVRANRKTLRVARLLMSWETDLGDRHVLHDCDNPRCVRPDHLYLGTNADNVRDRVRRGRGSVGSHRPQAKLTETLVKAMRRRADWEWSYARIGAAYGVTAATARLAVLGKTWKHVKSL